MLRSIVGLLAAIVVTSSTLAGPPDEAAGGVRSGLAAFSAMRSDDTNLLIRAVLGAPVIQQREECCKICTTGKACGDSCINRNYECHQPPGCACDG
ncbi:MAG: hypothetical protein ACREVI_05025 [Steroidobacteraceae bacterium]